VGEVGGSIPLRAYHYKRLHGIDLPATSA